MYNQIDTSNHGIVCAVAAAASTLAYSLAYGEVGTASTQTQIDLTGLDALATSGSTDDAGSEECIDDIMKTTIPADLSIQMTKT